MTVRDEWRTSFFWIVAILIGILLTSATWNLSKTTEIDRRVGVIEDSRFSKSDSRDLEIRLRKEMREAVDDIKDCLNQIQKNRECQ